MSGIEVILLFNWHFYALGAAGLLIGSIVGFFIAKRRLQLKHTQDKDIDQQKIVELRENAVALKIRFQGMTSERNTLRELIDKKEHAIELQRERDSQLVAKVASLKMALENQNQASEEKLKLLSNAKEQLTTEFELLANRIFEEKNDRFNKNNQATLDKTLTPLKEQLTEFKSKVEDIYDKDSKERVSLVTQLTQLKDLNQQMSSDAVRLTNALKGDNKTQGNWGEVILERVLEESGLRRGHEYDTQVVLKAEDGSQRKPDVIVRLPENKDVIIDSKVSLNDYERFCNSKDPNQKQEALAAHIASVRGHIKGLSIKEYERLEGIRTLDFVFIFIPIEPAFMAAFEHDPAMFKDAYEKNIIVVGPTTLLATLRTIQSIWRYERQNKNAEEIARQAGAMHDKFVGFIEDINKISVHIDKAAEAQVSALNKLSDGTGNLVSRTLKLEKLGAKVKKSVPAPVKMQAQASESEEFDGESVTLEFLIDESARD